MQAANIPPHHQNYRKPLSTLEFSQGSTDIVGSSNPQQNQGVPSGAPASMMHQSANMTSLTFTNHP